MTLFNPQPGAGSPLGLANPAFKLEYPQSIGVFTSYADAQKAVDSLADQNFPVNNLAIVGTELKLIERVTGRKTWGTVINSGLMNGLSTALMIVFILFLIEPTRDFFGLVLEAILIGVLIGVGFAALGHRLSRGQRDFTSITQTVPGKFEILCEHRVAVQARDLLSKSPDARGAALDPQAYGQAPYGGPQQPYPGQPPYGGQAPYGGPQQPYPGQPPYGGAPQPPYGQQPYGTQGGWGQAGPPYGQAPYGAPTAPAPQGPPQPDPAAAPPDWAPHREPFDPQRPAAEPPAGASPQEPPTDPARRP